MSETKQSILFKLNQNETNTHTTAQTYAASATFASTIAATGLTTYAAQSLAADGGLTTGDLFILTATNAVTVKT